MRLFGKTTIDFMGKRRMLYALSGSVILIGMISLAIKGVDYGIDFLGGTEMIVRFSNVEQINGVRDALNNGGFQKAEVKSYGTDRDFVVRTTEEVFVTTVGDKMREALKQGGTPI